MISRKVCLLGAFAVGKTSLVRRFVQGVFDDRYMTTLGVKIDSKTIDRQPEPVKLIIWDMEGADPADEETQLISSRMQAYLQGTHGLLLVADGTRPGTIETARRIRAWVTAQHPDMPAVLLLNKSDLTDQWQADEEYLTGFDDSLHCFATSALSGENVERAFLHLAEALARGD